MFVLGVLFQFVGGMMEKRIERGELVMAPVCPLLCLPRRLEEVCKWVGVRAFRAMRLELKL